MGKEQDTDAHGPIIAVILAAGESRRMGGHNKLLLPWGEGTVIQQTITNIISSSIADFLVVTGHQADLVKSAVPMAEGHFIYNEGYAKGFLTSVQAAIRRLPGEAAAVLIVLGDQPMVGPVIIDTLLANYRHARKGLVAPTYQGQRGNPVIINRRYFAELLLLPEDAAPRALLHHHPDDVLLVEVGDPAVLSDLDVPEDYARWKS